MLGLRCHFVGVTGLQATGLISKIGLDCTPGDLERDDLEHSDSRHHDHRARQIGTEASNVVVRDDVGISLDHNTPATVLSCVGLISLEGHC